jgi:GNAT superfamily N-acetyltransferase
MTAPMTHHIAGFRIDALLPTEVSSCASMTYPAYRHLLEQAPTVRLPSEAEQRPIEPVILVARGAERQIGMVIAELPARPEDGAPELLSVFVAAEHRREGMGTALVAAMEDAIRARGAKSLEAVYMTGKPSIAAMERIFEKRGWEAPAIRTLTVKFTMPEALAAPWYGRMGIPSGATIFSWCDLSVEEREQLRESDRRAPWIPKGLQPWRHDQIGFDPVSSVGLRYRGEIVGWVINHRIDPQTVRFTCSFMRKDLSRRARIVPLYSEAVTRLSKTNCAFCTFITPTTYPGMLEFIRRHCAPYASFTGETRGTRKSLSV